jgi:hypothetical protein
MAEKMDVEARIAHFLRVSQDPGATQAERDTAGREAERLLAKHAIDRLTLDVDGARRAEREPIETGTIVVQGGKGGVALDVVLGLTQVARSLGLVPYYSDRRSPDPWLDGPAATPHVVLSVTGFRSDVALALPLLESLRTQAVIAMRAWWRRPGPPSSSPPAPRRCATGWTGTSPSGHGATGDPSPGTAAARATPRACARPAPPGGPSRLRSSRPRSAPRAPGRRPPGRRRTPGRSPPPCRTSGPAR